jgi:hypothetical protein
MYTTCVGVEGCHPELFDRKAMAVASAGRKAHLTEQQSRGCCNKDEIVKSMAALANQPHMGYNVPDKLPEAFAIWRVTPEQYTPGTYANGGHLYPCLPSPAMVEIDKYGHCWASQDQASSILRINRTTHEASQLTVDLDGGKFTKELFSKKKAGCAGSLLLQLHKSKSCRSRSLFYKS